jgi:hypothetical protein
MKQIFIYFKEPSLNKYYKLCLQIFKVFDLKDRPDGSDLRAHVRWDEIRRLTEHFSPVLSERNPDSDRVGGHFPSSPTWMLTEWPESVSCPVVLCPSTATCESLFHMNWWSLLKSVSWIRTLLKYCLSNYNRRSGHCLRVLSSRSVLHGMRSTLYTSLIFILPSGW